MAFFEPETDMTKPILEIRRRGPARAAGSALSRRGLLAGMVTAGLLAGLPPATRPARAQADPVEDMIFNDPEVPVGGNPEGGLTIVTFFDYNCPYCKASSGPLDSVVREDGDIRLIYKDWPILTEASVTGALLALAAHRQGRYEAVHRAFMALERRADDRMLNEAARKSGIDADRLAKDMEEQRGAIHAIIARNNEQAEYIGLQGTPAYLVGPFLVTEALNEEGFREVAKDARARLSEGSE